MSTNSQVSLDDNINFESCILRYKTWTSDSGHSHCECYSVADICNQVPQIPEVSRNWRKQLVLDVLKGFCRLKWSAILWTQEFMHLCIAWASLAVTLVPVHPKQNQQVIVTTAFDVDDFTSGRKVRLRRMFKDIRASLDARYIKNVIRRYCNLFWRPFQVCLKSLQEWNTGWSRGYARTCPVLLTSRFYEVQRNGFSMIGLHVKEL